MAHTDRTTVVAIYIRDLLRTNAGTLGLDATKIIYGEQVAIPGGISVVIDSGSKNRTLQGSSAIQVSPGVFSGGRTSNRMLVIIRIYNSEYGSEEAQRLAVDQKAEAIEHFLHQDTSLNNNIIHGFVESWNTGITIKSGTTFRTTEMIYSALSKTSLPDLP